jgi:hypothetical protein
MECSEPLPRNPGDFRFQGIDGRGRQTLVRDPNGNRGVAVVRIEDSKGGREGYTFDLEWSGGSGSSYFPGGGGFGGGRPRWDDRNRYDDGPYTVICGSNSDRRRSCRADTTAGVRLVRELSNRTCRQNVTWGWDRDAIWVERGCRAEFEVGR